MAKKGTKRDGSKSEAVREYFKANPDVGAKAAHAELEKAGTAVSLALVNKVKYEGNTRKKKKATKRKAAAKRKAGSGNMSDQIRAYIAKHPKATRPEIRDGLAAQGVTVKTSLVNAVYTKVRKGGGTKAKPGRRGRKPAAAKTTATLSAAELIAAKQMIDSMGGADRVREALNLLDQLQ